MNSKTIEAGGTGLSLHGRSPLRKSKSNELSRIVLQLSSIRRELGTEMQVRQEPSSGSAPGSDR